MKENQRCGLVANAQHFAAVRSQRGGKIAVQLPHALSAQRAHARDNGLRVTHWLVDACEVPTYSRSLVCCQSENGGKCTLGMTSSSAKVIMRHVGA